MNDISALFILIFINNITIASHSCINNFKSLLVKYVSTSCFYHGAIEDSQFGIHKNDWFGDKSQMHGLEWMRFLVVNVMFMMRNTMMEDIKKYYFQDKWFKEP